MTNTQKIEPCRVCGGYLALLPETMIYGHSGAQASFCILGRVILETEQQRAQWNDLMGPSEREKELESQIEKVLDQTGRTTPDL